MIEMRWITVPAGSGRGMLYRNGEEIGENVLQYRESRRYHMGEVTHDTFQGVEWIDVPIPGKKYPSGG